MAQAAGTRSRGIKLPVALWDRIDETARDLGMSTNELVRRRLSTAFPGDNGNRKTDPEGK